jgi:60 kDa SS-A/Ro ribonucleoprotein
MQSPTTGYNGTATSKTTCVDVASLVASCVLRKNPENTLILPFDTIVHPINLNPNDSVLKNANVLSKFGGGGTDCASALRHLNENNHRADSVIFVSDNESWYGNQRGYYSYGGKTNFANEWLEYKKRNPKAKLVCIDISPNNTTQIPNIPAEVLNVGGFSDSVFEVVSNFFNRDSRSFAQVIHDKVQL